MAYIGREPLNGFFTKQTIANDGSTTTFALTHGIASTTAIIVSVNAVVLQPDVGYTISGGGTNIIFTSAPNATTYIHYLGASVQQSLLDLNGVEFILDADQDTTITADTDDEIDIKVGGTDITTIKSTGYHNLDSIKFVAGTGDDLQVYHDGTNSYITNAVGALRVATLTSGIAITLGHTTSEVTIADNLTVVGNLTIGGTTNFGDFNITNVGSIALDTITNDGTDITLDSSGDIILDAGGNDIFFKAGGTTIGEITNATSDLVIKSSVSDKDILIKGNDGGATITALTLDMSAAGAATFNSTVTTTGLVIGSTAVTSTAAELNLLDNVSGLVQADLTKLAAIDATADEIDLIDGSSANTVVNSKAVIYGSSGELAGTLSTVAQTNITSVGTLTALTVDDVAVDGKIIVMTGSTDDTFTTTVGTNGATSLVTVDTAGAAGHLTITADGTVDINSAGILTLDSGAAINIEPAAGSAILLDGAISIDAGVVTGATSITSTAFVGALTGNVTGNASGTAATVTTAAQSNITSLGTLTTLTVDNVIINGTTIGHTGDTDLMTVGSAILTVAGEVQMTTLDIGGTNVSATAAELNYSDLATLGTSAASKVLSADANNLTAISGGVYLVEDTLSFDATQDWDVRASPVAQVTLTANVTFDLPSNPTTGQYISILCIQDGTGSRTIAWNAAFEFTGGTTPTATTTAAKGDLFTFRYHNSHWIEVGRNLNLTRA